MTKDRAMEQADQLLGRIASDIDRLCVLMLWQQETRDYFQDADREHLDFLVVVLSDFRDLRTFTTEP